MLKDGMENYEESFLLNPHHLAFLQRIRRKENMFNVLCIKMGLDINVHVTDHKTNSILTLYMSEGYL